MSAWVHPFLVAYRTAGTISKAAEAAGISSATVYALRSTDADFAEAMRLAKEDFTDGVEQEAHRRAMGIDDPVVYQGQLTPVYERDEAGQIVLEEYAVPYQPGMDPKLVNQKAVRPVQARNADGSLKWLTIKKGSDALLLAILKANRKAYSTERTEVTGADGGPVQMDAMARRARIASIMAKASAREGLA